MQKFVTALLAALSATMASLAFAQAAVIPGWQVCWGPVNNQTCVAAVPLDPWLMVVISAILAIAAVLVLRRRTGFGAYLVAGVLVLAAAGSYQLKEVWAIGSDIQTTAANGLVTVMCNATQSIGFVQIWNNSASTVQLTVTPLNGANINWPNSGPHPTCGSTLPAGDHCLLPCSEPAPG